MRTVVRTSIAVVTLIGAAWLGQSVAEGCFGTVRPRCGQSVYVAKWAPRTVVHPGAGSDIIVPIGLAPYADFSLGTSCAKPIDSQLQLTLECHPSGGGASITVGPLDVPMRLATSAGVQQTLTGDGGTPETGGEYDFVIPAGTLPAGDSYRCDVRGTYSVTFANGIGAGTVTGTGDTEVCIVQPSPLDPGKPRFEATTLGDYSGLHTARKGDQVCVAYLLANNDPDHALIVNATAWTRQAARMPGATGDARPFSISTAAVGDHFAIAFADQTPPGGLIDSTMFLHAGEPGEGPNLGSVGNQYLIAPHGLAVVLLNVRSHGMCAEGSCSELGLSTIGEWTDGSSAPACVGAAALVADVPARSRLYEVRMMQSAGLFWTLDFSPFTVNGDPMNTLFAAGNNPDPLEGFQNRIAGLGQAGVLDFGTDAFDYLRMEQRPTRIDAINVWRQGSFLFRNENDMTWDLEGVEFPFNRTVPLFQNREGSITTFKGNVSFASDRLTLSNKQLTNHGLQLKAVYRGSYQDAEDDQANAVSPDKTATTRIEVDDSAFQDNPFELIPGSLAALFDGADAGEIWEAAWSISQFIGGGDPNTPVPDFTVSTDLPNATVSKFDGADPGFTLSVNTPNLLATSPQTTTGTLTIDLGNAGKTLVIAALRNPPEDAPPPEPLLSRIPVLKTVFKSRTMGKDKASLLLFVTPHLVQPTPEKKKKTKTPLPTECRLGVLDFGGLTRRFELDAKGKFKSADKDLKVKGKIGKDGMLQLKVKLTRQTFSGALADEGLTNADIPKPGVERTIPVRLFVCDTLYAGEASVLWTAKRDKSGKAKTPK